MGVLDKVKNAWKGGREETVTPSEEKRQAAAVREASESLSNAMQALIWRMAQGGSPRRLSRNIR